MHHGANGACAIILPLPKSDCRYGCLGFAEGTHIDILLLDALVIMGFRIERDNVKFAIYKEAATIATALWAGGCATTLSSNTLVFAAQMITTTLYHVLLPLVQTICTVAPTEHAPSFYHYPNMIAVPLVLASPEERISTSGCSSHHRIPHRKAHYGMHRGANGARTIILPLSKSDCRSACLGFAGRTHIDILLLDAPAIMAFRVERHTVKVANYKRAETIATAMWARRLFHNAVF
ncbi:hypothetical protein MRX96_023881 [Rhipicephalus microplus]